MRGCTAVHVMRAQPDAKAARTRPVACLPVFPALPTCAAWPPIGLPTCLPAPAERAAVEELKTQLGGVTEAMTKESELAEKLRREAQAAASSAQRQVRVFQYRSSSACVSKPRIFEGRLRCIVDQKWGGDVHCWWVGCFCHCLLCGLLS